MRRKKEVHGHETFLYFKRRTKKRKKKEKKGEKGK